MKLTISELNKINKGLQDLAGIEISGSLKFDIARNMRLIEEILNDAVTANNGSFNLSPELANKEVEVNLTPILKEDLLPLEIKPAAIYFIDKLLDKEEEKTDEAQ